MKWLWLFVALLLPACAGRGAIFVTIEGRGPLEALRVPQDVDTVACVVTSVDGTKTMLEKQYELRSDQQFPLTLGLEPETGATARVRIALTGLKQGTIVASTQSLVAMNPGEVTSVTMVLSTETQ